MYSQDSLRKDEIVLAYKQFPFHESCQKQVFPKITFKPYYCCFMTLCPGTVDSGKCGISLYSKKLYSNFELNFYHLQERRLRNLPRSRSRGSQNSIDLDRTSEPRSSRKGSLNADLPQERRDSDGTRNFLVSGLPPKSNYEVDSGKFKKGAH